MIADYAESAMSPTSTGRAPAGRGASQTSGSRPCRSDTIVALHGLERMMGTDSNCPSFIIDALEGIEKPTDSVADQKIARVRIFVRGRTIAHDTYRERRMGSDLKSHWKGETPELDADA